MQNLLIVESQNDQFFIEALIKKCYPSPSLEIRVDTPICNIDDYECLEGLGNLKHKLRPCIERDSVSKIGIILDADDKGIEVRLKFIEEALKQFDEKIILQKQGDFCNSKKLNLQFGAFIMNIVGQGELDTVLKTIAKNNALYADCLEAWQECLGDQKISQKELDKTMG